MKVLAEKYIILILFLCFSLTSIAQVKKGDEHFANFRYPQAIKAYHYALKTNSGKEAHVWQRLAESYRLMADYENAEIWYAKVVMVKDVQPINYFHYGKMLESNNKFAEAQEWFTKYVEKLPQDSRAKNYRNYTIEKSAELLSDNGEFRISSVSINSEYDDFSPCYFGTKLVFASNRPSNLLVSRIHSWNGLPFIDLFVSDIQDDGDLIDANEFPRFNANWHEGPVSFTSDLKRIYFTRNASRGKDLLKGINSATNLMLFTARKVVMPNGEELWTEAEALDFNSVEFSCQHPSISEDGQVLYFASDQPGGYGGMDIYSSERTILGWSKPKNLGPEINTSGDEAFPFISNTGKMYFASKGHLGVGGFDIFVALPAETGFSSIRNLGYPVNDVRDDFGFVLNATEEEGYFSSNRQGGTGRDDIYRVKVIGKAPEPVKVIEEAIEKIPTGIQVFVYDKLTGIGLSEAVVNVFAADGKLMGAVQVDSVGYAKLDPDAFTGQLRFITSYPEYASFRRIVEMDQLRKDSAIIELPLSRDLGKITSIGGKEININPIYFDYDRANIRPDAATELNKIVKIMKENPNMVIEVASHTDARGRNAYNEDLSERRARSSREYIIRNGISSDRVSGRGYGEEQPTNECEDGVNCPEAKHQLNRRTEFRIVRF